MIEDIEIYTNGRVSDLNLDQKYNSAKMAIEMIYDKTSDIFIGSAIPELAKDQETSPAALSKEELTKLINETFLSFILEEGCIFMNHKDRIIRDKTGTYELSNWPAVLLTDPNLTKEDREQASLIIKQIIARQEEYETQIKTNQSST